MLGADIAFFSLGLSISSAYTVLPLFVHHLSPSNETVALIPALRTLGTYGPPLLVAGMVERQRHALPFILKATILERVPFLVLALGALWLASRSEGLLLGLFLGMIFLATFGGGLTYPAWLDLIARTIPADRLGRFFGVWTGLGGLFGIGGAAVAAALLANVTWPLNFALCFLLTFGTFVVSFVLLSLGREPARVQRKHAPAVAEASWQERTRHALHDLWTLLRGDAGLQKLLVSNGLAGIATMAGALYAVAALRRGGLSDAQVGVESTVLFVAMTVGSFVWGAIGDRFGHRAILIYGSACAALAALVALRAQGFWAYAAVFLLLGLNLASTSLAGLTFITEFGPEVRRPTYVALAAVGYAPLAIGAPILGGALADAWGYVPVFIISAVAGVAATVAFQTWVPDPRKRRAERDG
jgi:MFS family permease